MIFESIITTQNPDNTVHIAPMGVQRVDSEVIIAPFKPSTTLDNLNNNGVAVINFTDDVRIFAGCLTGHHDWPTCETSVIDAQRLKSALTHLEVSVVKIEEDELRPRFICEVKFEETHAPFCGFNRAQAAVIEAAILVSRLNRLPEEKINREIDYLRIAIDKTAGKREREAWEWLMHRIQQYRQQAMASEDIV